MHLLFLRRYICKNVLSRHQKKIIVCLNMISNVHSSIVSYIYMYILSRIIPTWTRGVLKTDQGIAMSPRRISMNLVEYVDCRCSVIDKQPEGEC